MPEFAAKSLYDNQIYQILIQVHEVCGYIRITLPQKYVQVYNVILDISIGISVTKKEHQMYSKLCFKIKTQKRFKM